jgi:mono/diheme cytochrome c family protein
MKKVTLFIFLTFLTSCGDENSKKKKMLLGSNVYNKVCASCHEEGPGPDLYSNNLTSSEIEHLINFGKGIMPGFMNDLSENEVEAVVYYIINKNN